MMRKQTYVVKLNRAERQQLSALTRKGKSSATVQLKARILLHADTGKLGSGWNDAQISEALETYPVMCFRVRRTYATQGLNAVLTPAVAAEQSGTTSPAAADPLGA
jgi:hypothetical protein